MDYTVAVTVIVIVIAVHWLVNGNDLSWLGISVG